MPDELCESRWYRNFLTMGNRIEEGDTDFIIAINIKRTMNTNFGDDLAYRNHGTMHARFRYRQCMQEFVDTMCRGKGCNIGNVNLTFQEAEEDLPLMVSKGLPLRCDRPRFLEEIWTMWRQYSPGA